MIDFASYNPAFLAAFGESFVLTREEDLEDAIPATESITAIKCNPSMQEDVAPGDGSNYLLLWVEAKEVAGGTPVLFGNDLIVRKYASDFQTAVGVLDRMFYPVPMILPPFGIVRSIQYYNMATAGSGPRISAGNVFHAYVIRPMGVNTYLVLWDSGLLTVPATADPVGEIVTITVPDVHVIAGDKIAFYGSGIPFDVPLVNPPPSTQLYYPVLAAPEIGDSMVLGGTLFPLSPQPRTHSMAANVASTLPGQGDEISTISTVYKVVDVRADGTGGLYLKCRHDRAV
jgi:hypothetical protein